MSAAFSGVSERVASGSAACSRRGASHPQALSFTRPCSKAQGRRRRDLCLSPSGRPANVETRGAFKVISVVDLASFCDYFCRHLLWDENTCHVRSRHRIGLVRCVLKSTNLIVTRSLHKSLYCHVATPPTPSSYNLLGA